MKNILKSFKMGKLILLKMLDKERLEQEIKATKETIEKLKQIEKDSISGVEINYIVLKGLENALIHFNEGN